MRPVDIGIDAARMLETAGRGRVCAIFSQALYVQIPDGLIVVVSSRAPRGPLHLRMTSLPAVAPRSPVVVAARSLRIGDHAWPLDLPTWSRRLPTPPSLAAARRYVGEWLPDISPGLDVAPAASGGLPGDALAALRRGDLLSFAALVGGRGPGLTPAGDDILAGALLVARAIRAESSSHSWMLRRCAHHTPTNDIARAFLACASRGHCIEPAHDLLDGLADADRRAVRSAVDALSRFGSSSGLALTYGIRTALLELPNESSAYREPTLRRDLLKYSAYSE
jgi:hypothetical protein